MERSYEVRFDKYCKQCVFLKVNESEEPCFECLETNIRDMSETPIKFKKKGGETSGRKGKKGSYNNSSGRKGQSRQKGNTGIRS